MEKSKKTVRKRVVIKQPEIIKEGEKQQEAVQNQIGKRNIPLIIFFILFVFLDLTLYFYIQHREALSSLNLPFMKKVETGYIKNRNYTDRKLAVFEEINPKRGFQSKIILGNVIPKAVSYGVIDTEKIKQLYETRGGVPKEEMDLLTNPSQTPLTINTTNANWVVNLLWAIGLSNKMEINKESLVYGPDVNNFASTGGWTLGKKQNGGTYFNKHTLIPLTSGQEKRVKLIAETTYRPCCNNSTFFQDCNHGSAAMALIELGVSQGLSDNEIYKTVLAFNSFWFPQNYNEVALYFNVIKNTDWPNVDPKLALSKDYSSITGWMKNVDKEIAAVPGLLPKSQNGGSCGA